MRTLVGSLAFLASSQRPVDEVVVPGVGVGGLVLSVQHNPTLAVASRRTNGDSDDLALDRFIEQSSLGR
jgi:hypothetical protein